MAVDDNDIFWWHSIALGDGHVTPGERDVDGLEAAWKALQLPPLAGKDVLDIGAWDGWYSFRAEAEGAARVLALDSFTWSLDFTKTDEYWSDVRARQERGEPYAAWGPDCEYWDPVGLPGRAGFETARAALGSRVQAHVADIEAVDPATLGVFDVCLFLGVLYHLREPLRALETLRALTESFAVIETAAIVVDGFADEPLVHFVHGADVNEDPTNWFFPSARAARDLCLAAGFSSAEVVDTTEPVPHTDGISIVRLTLHARP